MGKKLVSVIIPVYKAEKYLKRCIDSVCNQSYSNLEIILIDDGSPDRCGIICDEYAKKDNRIKVLHIQNNGVSNARNQGMKIMTGDYVQFVDSDDYLKEDMTETLVNSLEHHHSDLVICGFCNVNRSGEVEEYPKEKQGVYEIQKFAIGMLKEPQAYSYGVLWNKLFKADVIRNHKLEFIQNITFGEDFIFNLSYMEKIKTVYVLQKSMYYYLRYNDNSLMYEMAKKQNTIEDFVQASDKRILIFKYYKKFCENIGIYTQNKNRINDYLFQFDVTAKIGLLTRKMSIKEKKQAWSYLTQNKEIKNCKKNITFFYRNGRRMIHIYGGIKGIIRKWIRKN